MTIRELLVLGANLHYIHFGPSLNPNPISIRCVFMENRTARLTILIDPRKKAIFEQICAGQDLTPSQVVRKLIRQYIIDNAGERDLPDWLKAWGQGEKESS